MRSLIAAALILLLPESPAFAHASEPHTTWWVWTFDPYIVVPLALVGGLYLIGSWRLRARSQGTHGIGGRELAFASGWITLAAALVSPLHWLGEHLFTFHMIEHEIVMAISAPLIVLARPIAALLWGLPRRARLSAGRLMRTNPVSSAWEFLSRGSLATFIHGIAIWAWHAPVLFDAAVENVALHRLQHLSFFLTAILFWWSVFWRSNRGAAAWHLFITTLHTGALGALMALSPRVLYVMQTRTADEWGLTPLEDQQLAGLMMWIPAGTIYVGAALVMAARWIATSSTGAQNVQRASSS